MKSTKLLFFAAALTAVTVFLKINSAEAACNMSGKVYYIYQQESYAYIFIAPRTTLPSYGYYYYTNDPEYMRVANAAMTSGDTLYVYGNASECPTSGTARKGGTITQMRRYKNI